MSQTFMQWANDPFWQSVLISPLIGAIFGVILSGFNSAALQTTASTPSQTIINIQNFYFGSNGNVSSSADGKAMLGIGIFIVFGVTYFYSVYAPSIFLYSTRFLYAGFAFIFTTLLVSAIKGYFDSIEWYLHTIIPVIFLALAMYLLEVAQANILDWARDVALRDGMIRFYMNSLNSVQRNWILTQAFGVMLTVLLILCSVLTSIYYVALANSRSVSRIGAFWKKLAWTLRNTGSWNGVFLSLIIGAGAYVFVSGLAYQWIETQHLQ